MESEFSRVFDALPVMIWTALPDGRVDFVNQAWCDYTGRGHDAAHGHAWHSTVHPDDLSGLLERWDAIVASGEPGGMQARLRRYDGRYHRFVLRVRPLADASGQVFKWCAVNTDVEDCVRGDIEERAREIDFQAIIDDWTRALDGKNITCRNRDVSDSDARECERWHTEMSKVEDRLAAYLVKQGYDKRDFRPLGLWPSDPDWRTSAN